MYKVFQETKVNVKKKETNNNRKKRGKKRNEREKKWKEDVDTYIC